MPSSDQPLHILLIEDHADLAANIGDYLEKMGHIIDFADNGTRGLALALRQPYSVVILDWMLPGMPGPQVCSELRRQADHRLPVLMLTARDQLADKLAGFEVGADDYLTKPFELPELLARCLALGRRHALHQPTRLCLGTLVVDTSSRTAEREGRTLVLPPLEFAILHALAEAYPAALTRSALCQHLWGDNWPDSDALRSHIYALRQVLDRPFQHAMLRTLHGVGFKLEIPS